MGMTCSLYRATETEIEQLISDPSAIAGFLEADDRTGPPVRVVRPKGLLGLVLRLFPITITEVAPGPAESTSVAVVDPDRSIDLDKAWHGLHFLFTGTADEGEEPACYLLRGGADLDDEGQARALRPQEVQRFATFLGTLTPAELAPRYNPERMTRLEIYPDRIWKRATSPGESPQEWLLESFSALQQFVSRAAADGHGVVIHLA